MPQEWPSAPAGLTTKCTPGQSVPINGTVVQANHDGNSTLFTKMQQYLGKPAATYQLTSQPHRLPPPGGLCGLETGPETFQIVTNGDADIAKLKGFVGKEISLKVDEVACAEAAGQMSEAIVTKWSVVSKR